VTGGRCDAGRRHQGPFWRVPTRYKWSRRCYDTGRRMSLPCGARQNSGWS